MKRAAMNWMGETCAEVMAEAHLYGGRADAYSPDADWIVECGNTAITKLVSAILDEDHPRFTLIPYQPIWNARDLPRRLIAVDFTWDDALSHDVAVARLTRQFEFIEDARRARRARVIAEHQAARAAATALAPSLSGRN